MTIKHIVISGGGPNLLVGYGVLKSLHKNKIWKLDDIKTIHSTSAGAMIALFIVLNIEWGTLDDYLIKRPWENVFHISPEMIFDAYIKKGIYNNKLFEDIFGPFFEINNLSMETTMEDLFKKTNIDLNIYATDINSFKLIKINKDSYPKLPVIKAIHMTSAIAPIFSPVFLDNMCLLDGGLLSNYPISQCLEHDKNIEKKEVLGILPLSNLNNCNIAENTTITEYLFSIIYKLIDKSDISALNTGKIEHEIIYPCEERCGLTWKDSILSVDFREKMINNGVKYGEQYVCNFNDHSKHFSKTDLTPP